jgi:GntR family transcriptional regulator
MGVPVIEFHLDARSGLAPYLQIVGQVRQALLLGLLAEGDKLPTVKEVVAKIAINPNTVSKAYRELEHLGLAAAKPGVGTFITRSLGQASLAEHGPLQQELRGWLGKARAAGLTEPGIEAMFQSTVREDAQHLENAASAEHAQNARNKQDAAAAANAAPAERAGSAEEER